MKTVMTLSRLLDPTFVFTGEKGRGLVTSIFSGGIAALLHFLGINVFGLSLEASTLIFMNIFGTINGYVFDILFAKRDFMIGGGTIAPLPYTELGKRFKWLMQSFVRKQFYRYLVTGLIEAMVGIAVLKAFVKYLDDRNILVGFKYRNTLAAMLVAVFLFLFFVNILRFDWAYRDDDEPILNIIVLMWAAIVLMAYSIFKLQQPQQQQQQQQKPAQWLGGESKESDSKGRVDGVTGVTGVTGITEIYNTGVYTSPLSSALS